MTADGAFELLAVVDLMVKRVEAVEVGAVLVVPTAAHEHFGCAPRALHLEVRELPVVAADVGLEASDTPFEFAPLGAVGSTSDGTELAEGHACVLEPPLRAIAIVPLAVESVREVAAVPGRVDRPVAEAGADGVAFVAVVRATRAAARLGR